MHELNKHLLKAFNWELSLSIPLKPNRNLPSWSTARISITIPLELCYTRYRQVNIENLPKPLKSGNGTVQEKGYLTKHKKREKGIRIKTLPLK